MNAVDWHEITKAKKLVRANDSSLCGNAIVEYRDNTGTWCFRLLSKVYNPKIYSPTI
ncbi:MAG: hypothetical protein WBZ36_12200 [Candidatus Nitrosopolaris sp.]